MSFRKGNEIGKRIASSPGAICLPEETMKKLSIGFAVVCSLISLSASAQQKKIQPGSKIYIEAADGFDTYLAAALEKKKVPLTIVDTKDKADYDLSGVSDHQRPGWAKVALMGQIHSDDQASVKLVDLKSGEVVFAYAVNKKNTLHGRQTAAEACAKHLKEAMDLKN